MPLTKMRQAILEDFAATELASELVLRFRHSNGIEFLDAETLRQLKIFVHHEEQRRQKGGTQQ